MTRPNVLVLMADQLNGTLFENGPADFLHAPNLKKLAKRSVNFNNAYTPSYLCAPGRAAFMSSQLPSRKCLFKINRAIGSVAVKQPVYLITQALKREVRTQWQPGILHPSP